jgi:hypothetical protein
MPRTATQPKKKSIYGVHPGVAMTQKWIAELKQRTGAAAEALAPTVWRRALPAVSSAKQLHRLKCNVEPAGSARL